LPPIRKEMYESSAYTRRRPPPPQQQSRSSNTRPQQEQSRNNIGGKPQDKERRRNGRQRRELDLKEKSILSLASLAGLGVWYSTPVSVWLTTILLYQIPIESDVLLGQTALKEFPYPTIYHPHWTPLVQQVGRELIETLEQKSNSVLEQSKGDSSRWLDQFVEGVAGSALTRQKHRELQSYQWDFAVVKAPIVNAFALPGGFIRVTDQLLEPLSPSRGELASLIGHEIGHCLFRHSQARMVQQKMFQLVLSALTYEDHDDDEESFGEALGELLLKSADWLGRQKFSRADEYQADGTGWALLLESNSYNPQSVQSLLTKLWDLQGKSPTTLDWMSTHPATEDRIEALRDKWQQLGRSQRRRLEFRPV